MNHKIQQYQGFPESAAESSYFERGKFGFGAKTKEKTTMNIKTVALTREQYQTIIQTMKQGFTGCRPNERVATALVLEANLGLRMPLS